MYVPDDQLIAAKFRLFEMIGYGIHHPEVERFHKSMARTKVCTAARRTTKSYSAAHDVLAEALLPNRRIWVVGPNYSLAEKEFRYIHKRLVIERALIGLPAPTRALSNARAGQLLMEFPWGTVIEGKSADNPEGLLGESVNCVIYAEAGQLPREIRERYVGPTLNTVRGREIVPTTPEEGAEWVYDLHCLGLEGKMDWIESFQWDGKANPEYDWEEFERAKEFYGADHPVFQEQYLGQWTFYGGRVYPMFNPSIHVIDPFDIPPNWKRIRAIDFGHRDPFVCLWGAVGPEGEIYIYREYYNREGLPTKVHAENIKGYTSGEFIRQTVADPSAKQLIEDLAYEGLYAFGANNDRQAGRQHTANYLLPTANGVPPFGTEKNPAKKYPRVYFFSNCTETIRELRFFRWKEKAVLHQEGVKERTEGEDHACDCLRYLLMTRPAPFREETRVKPGTFNYEMSKAQAANRRKVYG